MNDFEMKYKGSELEALVEGSKSALFYAGTIEAAYSIPGNDGAQVTVSDAFRTKYGIGENKEVFYIVDKRMIAGDDSNAVYIYPADFEGCYFVMGDFEGNDAIFSLGATAGDWVVVQGREWVKIATQKREIAGISGNVTTEALAQKLSTPTPTNTDPLAKQSSLNDFVRKDEAVDFATDLTGVVEATPEMFTYRPSAGDKSVRDESAVIRRIKGNTSVWSQRIRNGNFAEGTSYFLGNNSVLSMNSDGAMVVTGTINSSVGFSFSLLDPIPSAHKVLVCMEFQRSSDAKSNCVALLQRKSGGFDRAYAYSINSTERMLQALIIDTTDEISGGILYPFIEPPLGDTVAVYKVMLFDLTEIFDAGYEYTTYEEFRKYYPEPYYPYHAPEVRSMRATGIETIGFNAFNGEYAEVIGGQTYYLGGAIDTARFAKEIGGDSVEITIPENRLYTPSENGYIYATGNDICINISHSGVRNGEYKPYEKNTLLLPEIAKYFPDGMHGIGDECDEIIDGLAIRRIGVVDIGSLEWRYNSTSNIFYTYIYDAKRIHYNKITPAVMLLYTPVTYIKESTPNMSFSLNNQRDAYNFFAIRNTNYSDANSFTKAMQGVLLYYQLSEPIYTPIDEPLQLAYKVDDFGTEKVLSDAPSSPFKADIVYQFNAEGRIRDNSRNIERLEEQLQRTKEGIQDAGVQSDWEEDNPDSKAFIKNKPTMPTQVATAPEVIETMSAPSSMLPNVVYMVLAGLERFTLPTLMDGDANAHNVWKIIFISPSSSNLTFPDNIEWRDGIAPNWSEYGGYCELTFTKFYNALLGEWKLYK